MKDKSSNNKVRDMSIVDIEEIFPGFYNKLNSSDESDKIRELVEGESSIAPEDSSGDCTFLYFTGNGKWKYEGRGVFPKGVFPFDIGKNEIMAENGWGFPGIEGSGEGLILIMVPDEDCDSIYAHPLMRSL